MGAKVWLITGSGRGLGFEFAAAALERGDSVVATARNTAALERLAADAGDRALVLSLEVTDRTAVSAVVAQTLERFGRLDVVVNNAGYGIHGAVEELGEEEMRAQLETNFFGPLWVMQAVLPVMRSQRSGHILNVSSTAGAAGFALVGGYSASKFALEGISECLAFEAAAFGVNVTIVEPSDFRTGFRDACHKRANPIAAYEEAFADDLDRLSSRHSGTEAGDPRRAAAALLELVDDPNPPLRFLLGNRAFDRLTEHHRAQLEEWAGQETRARSVDG
ncbi:MAG TPA: SDR family NAD(P)-dependent oxidoreductase [Solirubrobacteraceae bacterium]